MAERNEKKKKVSEKSYEKELRKLQIELVKLQGWVTHYGKRIVVLFEGRDSAGKGGMIKRITEPLNHRVCRGNRPGKAYRKGEDTVVLPALCSAPPCRGRVSTL